MMTRYACLQLAVKLCFCTSSLQVEAWFITAFKRTREDVVLHIGMALRSRKPVLLPNGTISPAHPCMIIGDIDLWKILQETRHFIPPEFRSTRTAATAHATKATGGDGAPKPTPSAMTTEGLPTTLTMGTHMSAALIAALEAPCAAGMVTPLSAISVNGIKICVNFLRSGTCRYTGKTVGCRYVHVGQDKDKKMSLVYTPPSTV
jgi:hypothetical protein